LSISRASRAKKPKIAPAPPTNVENVSGKNDIQAAKNKQSACEIVIKPSE